MSDGGSDEKITRGKEIRRRRLALGISSVRAMALRSGVSRGAAAAAEHDEGSVGTYERLEAWLTEQERGKGEGEVVMRPIGDPAEQLLEVEVVGRGGFRMIVRGPVDNPEALADMADRLLRRMSSQPDDEPQAD